MGKADVAVTTEVYRPTALRRFSNCTKLDNRRRLAFLPTAGGEGDLCRFIQTDRGRQTLSGFERRSRRCRKPVGTPFNISYTPNIELFETLSSRCLLHQLRRGHIGRYTQQLGDVALILRPFRTPKGTGLLTPGRSVNQRFREFWTAFGMPGPQKGILLVAVRCSAHKWMRSTAIRQASHSRYNCYHHDPFDEIFWFLVSKRTMSRHPRQAAGSTPGAAMWKERLLFIDQFVDALRASTVRRGVTSTCLKFGAIFPGSHFPL